MDSFFKGIYSLLVGNMSEMISSLSWAWANSPSILPETSAASQYIFDTLYPYVLVICVASIIWQSIIMMLVRSGEPLINIFRGLITTMVWSSLALVIPSYGLKISDEMTTQILAANGGVSGTWTLFGIGGYIVAAGVGAVGGPMSVAGFFLFKFALFSMAFLAVALQYVVMTFRDMSVLFLAGGLALAASGSFNVATQRWLPHVLNWLLALIAYKPMVALVIVAGEKIAGTIVQPNPKNPYAFVDGIVKGMVMSVIVQVATLVALPFLVRFFSWSTGHVGGGGGAAAYTAAGTWVQYGRYRTFGRRGDGG